MHNYYHILGLRQGASLSEIKSAYRKLAFKYHPDHNPSPDARSRFLLITEAYTYLMDPPASRPTNLSAKRSGPNAESERVKRAQDAAKRAAHVKYATFKRKLKEEQETKHYTKVFNMFIATILLVGGVFFGKSVALEFYINADKIETLGHLELTVKNHKEYYHFVYEVEGKVIRHEISRRNIKEGFFRANDLPAIPGVQFVMFYRKGHPEWSYVDFESLSSITLKKYINQLRTKIQLQYDLHEDDIRVDCLCIQTFNIFGVDGLANLFFSEVPFLQNLSNNKDTFKTMEESVQYQRILTDCLINQESDKK